MSFINTNARVFSVVCFALLVVGCGSDGGSTPGDDNNPEVNPDNSSLLLQAEGRFDVCEVSQDFSDSVLPMESAWYEGSGGVCVRVCDSTNTIVPDPQTDAWAFDETIGQWCLNVPIEETRFGAEVPVYDSVPLSPIEAYRVAGQRLYARGDLWTCDRQSRSNHQHVFGAGRNPVLYQFAANGELSSVSHDPELPASQHIVQQLGYWVDSHSYDERLGILSSLDSFSPEVAIGPVFEGYTAYYYTSDNDSDVLSIFKTSDDKMVCERVGDTTIDLPAIDRREFTDVAITDVINVPMTCNLYEQTYYNEVLHGGTRLSALVDYPETSYTAMLVETDALTLEDPRETNAEFTVRNFEFGNEYRFISRTDNPQYNFMNRYAGNYMLASQTQTTARFRNGLLFYPASTEGGSLGAQPNSHSAFHRLANGEFVFEEAISDGGGTQFWEQFSLCRLIE